MKPHFPILFLFFSFLGTTEGWCGVAPRESLTVCRAGGGLWAEGSYRLDFFGSFCVKTKRTRENVDLSWSPKSTNRYLREGKEYVSDFDWNKYDFTGRTFDSWTLRALQVDPMAGKYYGTSPYALWGNNPIMYIDPDGENPLMIVAAVIGAVAGGYTGYKIADAKGYNFGDWQTWGYMLGGAAIGGASGYLGATVAAGGNFMANTMGIMTGSFANSMGMTMLSGRMIQPSISSGVVSYNYRAFTTVWMCRISLQEL